MKFKFNFLGLTFTSKEYLFNLIRDDVFRETYKETYYYVLGCWDSCIFGVNIRKDNSVTRLKDKFGDKK